MKQLHELLRNCSDEFIRFDLDEEKYLLPVMSTHARRVIVVKLSQCKEWSKGLLKKHRIPSVALHIHK